MNCVFTTCTKKEATSHSGDMVSTEIMAEHIKHVRFRGNPIVPEKNHEREVASPERISPLHELSSHE